VTNLDEALERFQICAMEYGPGFSNHGPMAAEALLALGHPALIPGLVDIYAPRLHPIDPGQVIAESEQAAAIGRPERAADWLATFEAELGSDDWRNLLARWLPRLVPGIIGAAFHGELRTAHAVRSLEREENALRLRELAFGLAYWASAYLELPGVPGAAACAGHGPEAFLDELEGLEPARRSPGMITDSVRALGEDDRFATAVARMDVESVPVSDFLGRLCVTAAHLYLAHPQQRVVYAHAVTGPSALRILLPHLDAAQQRGATPSRGRVRCGFCSPTSTRRSSGGRPATCCGRSRPCTPVSGIRPGRPATPMRRRRG